MTPLLHVTIEGHPHTWERVGWGRRGAFDKQKKEKENFRWFLKAASPMLTPNQNSRLGLILTVWTAKNTANQDFDNFLKFYSDAMTGVVWKDDRQVDDGRVIVHRSAQDPRIEILVWELP